VAEAGGDVPLTVRAPDRTPPEAVEPIVAPSTARTWVQGSATLPPMRVERIVPDLTSRSTADAVAFYGRVLGLEPVMDHGWIVTLAAPGRPGAQLSLLTHEATAAVVPDVSVEVDDVDAAHAAATGAGAQIVHPLTDEPWGVRRFFVRDPDGHVVNVLGHR
jgi:catechol 2,3-dioxygenase-like lactoylglutathione lyase family enzyme